jgi:hypothetical protein
MAFNPQPNTWIASWSEDGTTISVPIASFPELTAAEADGATGDIRKILYAICEQLYQEWNSTLAGDRPSKMTVGRTSTVNEANDEITKRYTFTFVTTPSATEVVDE